MIDARNPELEARLADDPESEALWLVYGDWLQQQGDPRGMHIALRAAAAKDLVAAQKLRVFEQRHDAYLRGGVAGRLGWGFVAAIEPAGPEELAATLALDAARFVTSIGIRNAGTRKLAAFAAALAGAPPTLRVLSIAGAGTLESIAPLRPHLARLRALDLRCKLSPACIAELAEAPMPRLTRLGLATAPRELLWHAGLDALDTLHVDRAGVLALGPAIAARLRHLILAEISNEGVDDLVSMLEAGYLPNLCELELPTFPLSVERARELNALVGHVQDTAGRFGTIRE